MENVYRVEFSQNYQQHKVDISVSYFFHSISSLVFIAVSDMFNKIILNFLFNDNILKELVCHISARKCNFKLEHKMNTRTQDMPTLPILAIED